MKNLIGVIILLLILTVWLFPCIISFYAENFWLIFLYIVWWLPASILTAFLAIVWDESKNW